MRLMIVAMMLLLMLMGCESKSSSDAGKAPEPPPVSTIKISPLLKTGGDRGEACAYSLRVASPWPDGGYFTVNYPEHLEYGPVGYTITRYSDARPSAWQVEREGKLVHYDVDSIPGRGVRGVKVASRVTVIEPDRLSFSLKITNNSRGKTLDNVKPLLCFQYKHLTGFGAFGGKNFKHTWVVVDGKITALADIATEKANPSVKGATVKGVKPFRYDFAKKNGGYIDKFLDLGLSVITSADDERALIIYAPVGKSMLSNRWIPCLHSDPHFGHIKPGESVERIQHVIFAGEDWRAVVKKIVAEHKG